MAPAHEMSGRRRSTANTQPASQTVEDIPSPCYGNHYGSMDLNQRGFGTNARVADDGRVNINIKERERRLSTLLAPVVHPTGKAHPKPGAITGPIPRLNVVIQIVGSRGDIQPFVALGRALRERYGHRVRLATHPVFRKFVESNGLEFFSVGVDPASLMAFMVKNPGLMPGFASLRSGDIGKRRKEIAEIISGCWRSCFEAGDGTGPAVSDADLPSRCSSDAEPFIADAIIANPPSFAHVHCAEKLGIPLHIMFTMPWSPTQAFPHPLANIEFSNTEAGVANLVSYALVEMLTWQGLGDIINKFRERTLGLEPVSVMWAPGIVPRLRIPCTYCWSPALLSKPKDWGNNIDISGFFFLPSGSHYKPPDDLAAFLASGPPPVYIGFGSIVVDQPNVMTKLIFEVIKKTGQRALVSQGWGGLGAEEMGIPDGVFMLGNVPHDWLFTHVSCVVHHGGAGTTAAGISCGKPTVIVPFFGDQPFWGSIVTKAGAGPIPIPHKQLTAAKLAAAIQKALEPETQQRAQELAYKINRENGVEAGVDSFHLQLRLHSVRCMLCPSRAAVWRVRRTKIRLSAFSATTLSNEGILDLEDLKLYRSREYDLEPGPRDPVSGGAAALLGSVADFAVGFADIPAEILRALPFPPFAPPKSGKKEKSPISQRSPSAKSSGRRRSSSADAPAPSPDRPVTSATIPHHDAGDSREEVTRDDGQPSVFSTDSKASYKEKAKDVSKFTSREMMAAGHATSNLVMVGLKSPMNFALGIAKGFHNLPRQYHDRTVRDTEKITGIHSGLRAAGKEFGYGFYDGISGLVTQPLRGRNEGAAGVIKGFGKGLGGFILKPGAGIFALAGYTLNGVYKEVQNMFGTSVECYIVACRSKQGYDEWSQSTKEERDEVMEGWYSLGVELESKAVHSPFAKEWDLATRVLMDSRGQFKRGRTRDKHATTEAIGTEEKIAPGNFHEALRRATHLMSDLVRLYKFEGGNSPVQKDDPTAERIAKPTSNRDSAENAMFEHALREGLAELSNAEATGDSENAYERAIVAGMEAIRETTEDISPPRRRRSTPSSPSREGGVPENELHRASLKEGPGQLKEGEESEIDKIASEGVEDVTEYAIWKTLTEQRRCEGQDQKSEASA